MISNTILSPEASSSLARRKFWLGSLQVLLIVAFILHTIRWLDRSATGAFWQYPLVHGFAILVLAFYSILAARGITRIVRHIVSAEH